MLVSEQNALVDRRWTTIDGQKGLFQAGESSILDWEKLRGFCGLVGDFGRMLEGIDDS